MRTATLRAALLVLALGACAGRAKPSTTPASSIDDEDLRAHERADLLRSRILAAAGWADFAEDKCNPGALRTFSADTSKAAAERVTHDIESLESMTIARGVENSIDTPEGHELLRLLVIWEAGSGRPNWDVRSGEKTRQAIAAGLSGEYNNPATNRCESYVKMDSIRVVIPAISHFTAPNTNGVRTTIVVGDTGLATVRSAFFSTPHERDMTFDYSRIRALVLWRDYAVAAVNRPTQSENATLANPSGGAAYIFHRVGKEWRLLTITRTWG